METIPASALHQQMLRFPSLSIGVAGDFALDGYWEMDEDAAVPSIETGLPTRPVRSQRYAPGAAGNVALNLAALGCGRVLLFGVIGRDPWGDELRRRLSGSPMDPRGLRVQNEHWATLAYLKPHRQDIEQNRWDFGDFNRLSERTEDRLLSDLEEALPDLDAVVLNDQARAGLHTGRVRARLQALISQHPDILFVLDSRDPDRWCPGPALKLNVKEAARCCGLLLAGGEENLTTASTLANRLYARQGSPVFVTCGKQGIAAHGPRGPSIAKGIQPRGEVDATGAGDSVLAAVTAMLAAGGDCATAAVLGNLAAAVTVQKRQCTGTASPEEILQLLA